MVLLMVAALAEAACPDDARLVDLSRANNALFEAWKQLDQAAVAAAADGVRDQLACAREPLGPPDVAQSLQTLGLAAFLAGDTTTARAHLRGALGVLPASTLPSNIAGPGDAWYEMYEALRLIPAEPRAELPAPAHGWLLVDGLRARDYPVGRSWVFQQLDDAGAVVRTLVVPPSGPLPIYEAAAHPPSVTASGDDHRSRSLLISGLAVGAAGVACLGGAAWAEQRYEHTPLDQPTIGLEAANLLLGGLGYLGVAGGLGLGVGAGVVGRW